MGWVRGITTPDVWSTAAVGTHTHIHGVIIGTSNIGVSPHGVQLLHGTPMHEHAQLHATYRTRIELSCAILAGWAWAGSLQKHRSKAAACLLDTGRDHALIAHPPCITKPSCMPWKCMPTLHREALQLPRGCPRPHLRRLCLLVCCHTPPPGVFGRQAQEKQLLLLELQGSRSSG